MDTGNNDIEVSSPTRKSKETSISTLAGQPFEALSTAVVSRNQKVTKTILYEWIKKLLRHCNRMCAKDIYTVTEMYDVEPPAPVSDNVCSTSDDVKQSICNVEASLSSQNTQLQAISSQLSMLQSRLSDDNCPTPPLVTTAPIQREPPPTSSQQCHPGTPTGVKCYDEIVEEFLVPETHQELSNFLSSCQFTNENGHSVVAYGERYHYTGSKAATSVTTAFPDILAKVAKSVGDHCQCEVNSVLINHYPAGDGSFLPEHSDDESSIDPDSHICTLSVGGSRTLTFKEKCNGSETVLGTTDNSLYTMSRHSQNFFTHRIDKATDCTDRYSLTFRCVGGKFRRSTIIIGDSLSKEINFGEGAGTLGRGLPGKYVKASTVHDICPTDCLSYSNVIIQCGINDLRPRPGQADRGVNINAVFNTLKNKVNAISKLKSNINIFICPVLPSRSELYLKRAIMLNNLIRDSIVKQDYRCTFLNVSVMCDSTYRTDLLDVSYSKGDLVHLNRRGTGRLAAVFKEAVYLKYNSGKGGRVNSSQSYASAAQGGRRDPT